jgi:hypothetical protein
MKEEDVFFTKFPFMVILCKEAGWNNFMLILMLLLLRGILCVHKNNNKRDFVSINIIYILATMSTMRRIKPPSSKEDRVKKIINSKYHKTLLQKFHLAFLLFLFHFLCVSLTHPLTFSFDVNAVDFSVFSTSLLLFLLMATNTLWVSSMISMSGCCGSWERERKNAEIYWHIFSAFSEKNNNNDSITWEHYFFFKALEIRFSLNNWIFIKFVTKFMHCYYSLDLPVM